MTTETISYIEKTVTRVVSATFPDFILDYHHYTMHLQAFIRNYTNKFQYKPILATAYDITNHLLYSGSPSGNDVYSIDPYGTKHDGYYVCGVIGRRNFIVKEQHMGLLRDAGGSPLGYVQDRIVK